MRELENKTLRNQYFLRKFIDSGGMADVYQAWDQERRVPMAIKVLRKELAGNERFTQMLEMEAENLSKLAHPNIVRLYEMAQDRGLAFLVMDWVEGENLRRMIMRRRQPLTLQETGRIIDAITPALSYAHSKRIYHCDVKPANVLLHNDGRVLLTDFGVARHAANTNWGGTPVYMAPEQFPELNNFSRVDDRTDVYSLGITIYEMLTGGWVPYRGDTPGVQGHKTRERIAWEIQNVQLPSLNQINPQVPQRIEQVIRVALNRDPGRRYRTVFEFNQALQEAIRTSPKILSPALPPTRPGNTLRYDINPGSQPQSDPGSRKPVPDRPADQMLPDRRDGPPPANATRFGAPPEVTGKFSSPLPIPANDHSPLPAELATKKGPLLIGRSGEWKGKVIEIPRGSVQFGRSSENQVQLREPSVSRLHVSFVRPRIGRGVFMRDENSRMGVLLNGQRIHPAELVELKDGDRIQIGQFQVFEFRSR